MEPPALLHKRSRRLYPFVRAFTVGWGKEWGAMLGLALSMFIAVFAFGQDLLGWNDPTGQVKLGLFMSFLFGIICGYRTPR
jgi:hypothetical protein